MPRDNTSVFRFEERKEGQVSRSLNKVMLIGRLGAEPELRYTPDGTAVTRFRLAVNRRTRRSEGQEPREETDWFTVVGWEKLAETMGRYLVRGARVYVEGRLQTRSWEGQDGQRRTATEVVASDLIMLDSRPAPRHAELEEDEGEEEDPRGTALLDGDS